MYNPRTRYIIHSRDVKWDKWDTKDPKTTLREHRQVFMQSLIDKNNNGWSESQTKQFNDILDHYLQPAQSTTLAPMPDVLDYADFDLLSHDESSHLLADPPNEEEEPYHDAQQETDNFEVSPTN